MYERVGNEIDKHMSKSIKERENEINDEYMKLNSMDAEDLEMKRLREAQEHGEARKAENMTITDLFNKYNI